MFKGQKNIQNTLPLESSETAVSRPDFSLHNLKEFFIPEPFTDEEIEIANKTGKIPKRYIIQKNSDNPRNILPKYELFSKLYSSIISNKQRISNQVPEGYEIKRANLGGHCLVVPKDAKGLYNILC